MKIKGLVLCAVSLLVGCSMMDTKLPEGKWQETTPSIGSTPMSLDIKEGHIGAYAGCNRMFGSVEMHGNKLATGQMATTLMACYGEEAKREDTLASLLSSQPQVSYEGNALILKTNDQEYRFSPEPSMEGGVTRFIYIAAGTVPCTGVAPTECLQVRENKEDPWELHYDSIEGFEPEPGIAYRLRIKEFDVPNPPADASSKRWVLDMIIEQRILEKD